MTDERQNEQRDPLVSRAYRDLAGEQTSRELDEKILGLARGPLGSPVYTRLRLWTRPLAWAAVLSLSLVIVLQVTQLPVAEPEPAPETATPEEIMSVDVDLLQEAEEMARLRTGEQLRPEKTLPSCDEAARSTEASWLECINELEEAGRRDEAASERLAFELQHPAK
jgi:hypothetical protein